LSLYGLTAGYCYGLCFKEIPGGAISFRFAGKSTGAHDTGIPKYTLCNLTQFTKSDIDRTQRRGMPVRLPREGPTEAQ
jgi:hypothetical protein